MDMRTFPKKMQKLLLMKEKEYGELKFILSRATDETSRFIDELLKAVENVAKECTMYNVKIFHEDFKFCDIPSFIISNYNYFILNTNFSTQYLLAEDLFAGSLVSFWPTLSPYLFIQMILHIKCEDLLIESLIHLPLDICVEILEITIRCINELEALRDRRFVFLLICKLYYKCMSLHTDMISKHDAAELACQLVAHFQVLLDLVSSKLITFESLEEKYVQHGILLKDILRCVKTCMGYKTKNLEEDNVVSQTFKITYGNPNGCTNYSCKLPIDKVQSIVATLNQELVNLLQDQVKRVDCFEFMEWAEVDDKENIMISLQRAIIIECHCFMEFMKCDEFLLTNEHLLHCLQQLVGSSEFEESILTFEEICDSITSGKLDKEICIKELMKHYKKWDLPILNFISRNTKLLNEENLDILLEYLHYIFTHAHTYEEKYHVYMLVLKILIQKHPSNIYPPILQYTLRHFHDNRLACLFNSEHFNKFIEGDTNMPAQEKLLIILIFVILNPKKVLSTLVRVAVGSTETKYRNVMLKRSYLAYVHSFLILKLDDQNNLLTYLLNDAWLHDHSMWRYKKFETFMNDMLETEAITPDDLLNNVYIPCLSSDAFNCSNLLSVLMHMYFVLNKKICTHKTNYVQLIVELTKKMSMLRKCSPRYSRNSVNNLLDHGTMILNLLFTILDLTPNNWNKIINNFMEPIDQILLEPQMLRCTVQSVIQNYERRCIVTYQLLRANPQCEPKMRDYVRSFRLDQKALLRHMMLHATEEEYKKFALELTIVSWSYFGWANELEAYKNILDITVEAMQLALVFTNIFPKDRFVSLLRALIQYYNILSQFQQERKWEGGQDYDIAYHLSETLFSLKTIVNETQHGKVYNDFFECINNTYDESNLKDYFHDINKLIEIYFLQPEEIENRTSNELENGNSSYSTSNTSEIVDMFKAYQFVCKCIDDTSYNKRNTLQLATEQMWNFIPQKDKLMDFE